MLKDPSHHLRQSLKDDLSVDRAVSSRFGPPSYRQLAGILQSIKHSLDEIYEETRDLPEGLTKPVS